MNNELKLTLPSRPITKKNSQQIVQQGGRYYIIQKKAYRLYEEECLWLLADWKPKPIKNKIILTAHYWLPNKRGCPDLVGLLQATCDILEKAKVIENDRYVAHFGDSKIMGIDKKNPRTEIFIKDYNENKTS